MADVSVPTATAGAELAEALGELRLALEHLDALAASALDDGLSPEQHGLAAWHARQCATAMTTIRDFLESTLAERLPWGEPMLLSPDAPMAQRRGKSGSWNWDHLGAARDVARRVADRPPDLDDGPPPPAVLASMVAEAIVACAGIGYWRIEKGEKDYGLDFHDHRSRKASRQSTVEWLAAKGAE